MRLHMILLLSICWPLTLRAQSGASLRDKRISIGEIQTLHSAILGEDRQLNVYLPEGYQQADTAKYPVIFLLDGGLDEDFLHVAGLVQFSSQPWVGYLQPSIVVGVANTDRKRDMTFPTTVAAEKKQYPTTGGSAKFIGFLEKELKPFIEKAYRTKGAGTLIGESLGGLLATEILLSKPRLFDQFIIISPSIWWDNGSILDRPLDTTKVGGHFTQVFIAVGKEGLTPGEKPRVQEVDANLLQEKLDSYHRKDIGIYFDYLPNEKHATISHQAIYNALRYFSK